MIRLIERYFDKLFPLNRSITGKDYQKSLNILNEIIPLKKINFKSGQKVFDWKIPLEWNVNEAYLKDNNNKKIIDFAKNNLHLLGYSKKFIGNVTLKNLKDKLHYIKRLPTAIPYVTSYYKKTWGLCISYNEFKKLKNEKYKVVIDTTFKKGKLTIGESFIKGKSKKEILFSTNLCHPSMANNELSGPLTIAFLYNELKKLKLKYSVRFVIGPEGIGAVALLSKYKEKFKKNVVGGYQLTCCGLKKNPFYKKSKKDNSLIDIAIKKTLINKKYNESKYFAIGSDECRYNSLGINIPMGAFMRTNFDNYKQYHTSLDNKKILSFKKIRENVKILSSAVSFINKANFYKSKIINCEPFLSKKNIYSSLSKFNSFSRIDSDIEISQMSNIKLLDLNIAAKILVRKNLLEKIS